MSIALHGILGTAHSSASGAAPGNVTATAVYQTYDDAARTKDAVFVYGVAPGAVLAFDTIETIAQNGPRSDDGLSVQLRLGRINAGDSLIEPAWALGWVSFSGFRASFGNPGPDYDQCLPYDNDHRDGWGLASGAAVCEIGPLPVQAAETLAILAVAYLGPSTAGRIDTPTGWTALPEVTGGAPGETQRTVCCFYRVVDCSAGQVSASLTLHPGGDRARYYASLVLLGLVATSGVDNSLSPSLCTLPATDPSVTMPAAGTNRGWYSVDFHFLPGKSLASLVCPSAASDNYGRLWHVRWSGDYPPVPETPVEIIDQGVFGAALLPITASVQYAFYYLAASPLRLRYRQTEDGGRTWSNEVQVLDGGGAGTGLSPAAPANSNNAPAVLLLPNGRLIVARSSHGGSSPKAVFLQRDEGTGEWTYLHDLATVPFTSSETLAVDGETLQVLRDRTVMRPRTGGTLRRFRAFLDDGTYQSDNRVGIGSLGVARDGWINERSGLLLTAANRVSAAGNVFVGKHPVLAPSFFAWRVYKLLSDETYGLTGVGGEVGINAGDARSWEGPAMFVWDPDNLVAYGPGAHNYSNGVCRLRIDAAGLWWLLRPGPDGDLRFARGRRLADFGTCQWEGKN